MRKFSLGLVSIVMAVLAALGFAVHYAAVFPVLNSMLVPIISLIGLMLAVVGYFERDKKRNAALLGMICNALFLIAWLVLLLLSL